MYMPITVHTEPPTPQKHILNQEILAAVCILGIFVALLIMIASLYELRSARTVIAFGENIEMLIRAQKLQYVENKFNRQPQKRG
ncbi:hypothetical protein L596_023174 [Steinernema carpocapsae]|uniref:Uncharacterized protein n=1 Tax=Steinernema carpocapsae TaxID=34508 RepID=A0A4U5MCX2_STECR|nr:hypothetical protein L596_023174 [Steinernema carpocapsae]